MGGCNSYEYEYLDETPLVPHDAVSIFDPKYATQVPVRLRLKERMWSDNYVIKDELTDVAYFQVHESYIMPNTMIVQDFKGNDLAYMRNCGGTFREVFNEWFSIKLKMSSAVQSYVKCDVVDCMTGLPYHFSIDCDFSGHRTVIFCNQVAVARVEKTYCEDLYYVNIAPGVDMAFIVLLCVAMDEAGLDEM